MLFKFLLFFSFYLPFQIALNPTPSIDLASIRVFILILFSFWLLGGLKNKKISIGNGVIAGLIASFLFLSLFSIFFAENISWSLRKLLYLFSIFPIYFVASGIIDSEEKGKKILKALVYSGTAVAILGIIQFVAQFIWGIEKVYTFWSEHLISIFLGKSFSQAVLANSSWLVNISGQDYFRAISIFPDPHMFSIFLGLLLPLAIGLFAIYKKKQWLVLFLIIFLANILTFSRGGYLGLIAGGIFVFLFFWKRIEKKYKIATGLSCMIILFVLIMPNPVSSRFFSSFDFQEGSNLGRIEMWRKAGEVIIKNPFFGAGIGNFPLKIDPMAGYREPIYAHSTYLDIASETGVPALLCWAGILAYAIFKFIKKSKDDIVYLFLAVSLVIFSAHSIFETGIYSPANLTLLLVIISLANSGEIKKYEKMA